MDDTLSQLGDLFNLAENFNKNLTRSFQISVIPELAGIAGVLFLHWGVWVALTVRLLLWIPLIFNMYNRRLYLPRTDR